jgi:hypothetical protein
LHQAEQGTTVGEIARKMGITLHRLFTLRHHYQVVLTWKT